MTPIDIASTCAIGSILGFFLGVPFGMFITLIWVPRMFFTTIWFEVSSEWDINVADLLKHQKGLRRYPFTPQLELKKDGKTFTVKSDYVRFEILVVKDFFEDINETAQYKLGYIIQKVKDADIPILHYGVL